MSLNLTPLSDGDLYTSLSLTQMYDALVSYTNSIEPTAVIPRSLTDAHIPALFLPGTIDNKDVFEDPTVVQHGNSSTYTTFGSDGGRSVIVGSANWELLWPGISLGMNTDPKVGALLVMVNCHYKFSTTNQGTPPFPMICLQYKNSVGFWSTIDITERFLSNRIAGALDVTDTLTYQDMSFATLITDDDIVGSIHGVRVVAAAVGAGTVYFLQGNIYVLAMHCEVM